jgi:HTH-type transcriptional regulator / antitoxin HipB
MDDLEKYIEERKKREVGFAEDFEEGYLSFKIGVLLRQAREDAGLTQENIAKKLRTTKAVISRMENHAENMRLSTLEKYMRVLGNDMRLEVKVRRGSNYPS